ncbi:MAG: hypothetical protein NTV34_01515, partial [Proteobacteria bacterium]|nr:hypothetical protein [Pseudomonadota bacterium]
MISEKFLNIVTAQSWGAYYFEDLTAIRQGRIKTSERYSTRTNHNRFPYVRTPAPSLSIGIVTQDLKGHKRVSWGDCVPVSFSGKSGRVQAMPQEELELFLQEAVLPWLLAPSRVHSPASWLKNDRELASEFAQSPPYVRYGLSQALLRAAALARGIPLWQVFQEDFAQTLGTAIIPLQGSCGGDWDDTVDRMLARQIPFLPQGQFEDLPQQLGTDGASLLEWIRKFKLKVERFGYAPTLTLDFHGALDDVFHRDIKLIAG